MFFFRGQVLGQKAEQPPSGAEVTAALEEASGLAFRLLQRRLITCERAKVTLLWSRTGTARGQSSGGRQDLNLGIDQIPDDS